MKLAGQAEASVNITKGEANARVILVNAQSEAEKTKLEGNAEAGIVFTKGEAEAKALELRAQAYRQFNEAAVIQTVLSMLPEIVRAAAEPMANIKDLTVLSTDGASELVRNGTRTVAEASAVVKGVTGIDIPSLIGSAMGGRGGDEGGGGGSEGGCGRRRRRQGSRSSTVITASVAGATAGRSGRCDLRHGCRRRGIVPGARLGLAAGPDGSGERSRDRAGAASAQATPSKEDDADAGATAAAAMAEAAERTGAPTMEEAQAAMDRADIAMQRAREATATAFGSRPEDVQPITTDTSINVAAQRLARDLQAIPGIERFGTMRLAELDRTGPRPLRTMWRIARSELGERYGEMTIGEVLDRYGPGDGTSGGSSATHA